MTSTGTVPLPTCALKAAVDRLHAFGPQTSEIHYVHSKTRVGHRIATTVEELLPGTEQDKTSSECMPLI